MSRSAQPFGRYELLERISAGGMAEVFRARDTEQDRIVALKRILPQIAEDEEFIRMFEDEARIASQLEHPHIARTLDFGRVQDSYYIAFEYVNGRDLRTVFDRSSRSGDHPPLPFLLYVFARIGEGLAYAHARRDDAGSPQGIVHRDVSPQNIIVSFDGDVKLIDFGIAKAAGKLSRTQVGTLKGKFGYMSPEQIKGGEIDHRADLFSLGICMWELLTLERLFMGENELLVLEKVRSATIAPPSSRYRDIPPELDRVVLKALAKDPNERYRAAKDLFRDLERLAQTIGATGTRDEVARYMRRTFPESLAPKPTPSSAPAQHAPSHQTNNGRGRPLVRPMDQETSIMAADIPSSDKRGSDLDIFEGLGKKGSAPNRNSSVPPPPPSRQASVPVIVKSDVAKKTLVGISPGSLPAPGRIPTPPPRSAPPPPPGRGSLPQVVPPPPRASAHPPPAAAMTTRGLGTIPSSGAASGSVTPPPSPAPTAPAPPGLAKSGLDMDWDDEDEATHIFDKVPGAPEEANSTAPRPAAGTPLAPPVGAPSFGTSGLPSGLASTAPPPPVNKSQTLLGMASPAAQLGPPPPRASAPPPPPPSNAFARASGPPPGFPPPPGGHGAGMAPQVSTVPMGMPGRPASVPPPQFPQDNQAAPASFTPRGPLPPIVTNSMAARMEATQLVRPPPSRIGVIGTGVVFAGLAAALVVYLMMPRTGRIAVNVSDGKGASVNRVEIFVDGKKQCDTAPCIVDQVSAGSHQVKVLAPGFETPGDRAVTVDARKDSAVDFTMATTSVKGTGIKVSGNQPGVKLYVDGKEVGPLPQELHDLAPGDHKIRLAGTDRYAPFEKNVIVAQDEIHDLGDQTLKVVKGKATITLGTMAAKVSIVSGSDRREFPTLPIAVDLDTAKPWALEASKPGFTDYHQAVSFDDGVAEKTFNIVLEPRSASALAVAPAQAAPAQATPTPRPVAVAVAPRPAPAPKDTSDDSPPAAAGGGGESFLNINSIPASSVVLDGKPIGNTPKVHVSVSPGAHTVVFVNADQGLKKQISVNVGAGETKPAIAKLRE